MGEGIIVEQAKLRNFAGFKKIKVEFADGVNYLLGNNGSGKTSLAQSIVACVKGIAEQAGRYAANRIKCIGTDAVSGDIEWKFKYQKTGQGFFVKNHITKSGNNITFRKDDDSEMDDDWLKDFLNVSLMSAKNFCSLSGREQAVELGIDTSTFDENIKNYKAEITFLNRKLKDIGKIEEVETVERIDVSALLEEKAKLVTALNNKYTENQNYNQKLREEHEAARAARRAQEEEFDKRQGLVRDNLLAAVGAHDTLVRIQNSYDGDLKFEISYPEQQVKEWLDNLPQPQEPNFPPIPDPEFIEEMPDDSEIKAIDQKMADADRINIAAEKHQEYLKKVAEKKGLEKQIQEQQQKVAEEATARAEYIKQHDFGFSGLSTDDDGNLLFRERPIREPYLSRGELELIVAKLATSLNPLFKTRFIDEFGVLDPDNQKKILDDLVAEGFQPIVLLPGEKREHENTLVLRDCELLGDEDGKPELL